MKIISNLKINKIQWIFALILSAAYSAVSVAGPMIYEQMIVIDYSLIIRFMLYFISGVIVNLLVFALIPKLSSWGNNNKFFQRFNEISQQKLFWCSWIFILFCWIPAFMIFYPGILSYDMLSQTYSALDVINNNHHPVLHTWLIRVFLQFGNSLCSSYEFGIGLLSVLQMLLLSYSLARMVCLLKRKKVPVYIVLVTLIMSAIWFMNACLSVTMIKDCLHAAFLVLFVCHFAEIVTEPSAYIKNRRNWLIFPAVSFLMCAFRNNGIYIYVFCFAVLAVLRVFSIKKIQKTIKLYMPLVLAVILPILMYEIYTGPVFKYLNIEQGQVREALCIPIQQIQRTAISEKDNLTEEQTELVAYYIDQLQWMPYDICVYDPFMADFAKSCFYSNRYMEDPAAFWKFYLQMGMQYPKEYVEAFLTNTLGFWYPGFYRYSYVEYHNYAPERFVVPLERKSIWDFQPLKDYYKSVCTSEFWRETPVLRLFFVPAFTIWFLLYAIALSWGKDGFLKKRLPMLLPLIGQYGIMILSPMSSFRYAWPFYLMLPIAFVVIFGNVEEE